MDGLRFKSILKPLRHQTEEECIRAVRKNYRELQWVREQTPAICKAALDTHVHAIVFIRSKTPELCEYALQKNGYVIRFIPQSEAYCWMALRSPVTFMNELMDTRCEGVYAIQYIDNPTDEMIRYAINTSTQSVGRIFAFIPEHCLKEEHILYGLELYPNHAQTISGSVPNTLQTYRLALEFVKLHPYAIQNLEDVLKTAEISQTAFEKDPNTIIFIPMEHQTQAMIDVLVEKEMLHAYMIDRINSDFFSEEFFQHVICNIDPDIFGACPDEYKTSLLCRSMVKYNPMYLEHVPEGLKTQEMCEMAVKENGRAIAHVPDSWKKPLYLTAVRNDYFALALLPSEDITHELAEVAMAENMEAFSFVPKRAQTHDMCKRAVQHDWTNIRFCRFKTAEICNLALERSICAIRFIKSERNKPANLLLLAKENARVAIDCLKSHEYTMEICDALLEHGATNIRYFLHLFQTRDMHIRAMKLSTRAWYHIPRKYRTSELKEACLSEIPETAAFFTQLT